MIKLLKRAGGCNTVTVHQEIINDEKFDIVDFKNIGETSIKKDVGTGTVTYDNPTESTLCFIAYEDFLNKLQKSGKNLKGIKRCDFVVYTNQNHSLFLLNELSEGINPANKRTTAKQQLHATLRWLFSFVDIKEFILKFTEKKSVFSYKKDNLSTPVNDDGRSLADSFLHIQNFFPDPIEINYQPIDKYEFKCFETNCIKV